MAQKFGSGGPLWVGVIVGLYLLGMLFGADPAPPATPVPASTPSASVAPAVPSRPPLPSVVRFVAVDRANVRDAPDGQRIDALVRGTAIDVHEVTGAWSRVAPSDASPRWIANRVLCSGADCWKRPVVATTKPTTPPVPVASLLSDPGNRTTRQASTPRPIPNTPRRAAAVDTGHGCPCSSPRNCYGPRGGRYCITSGGNKRYR